MFRGGGLFTWANLLESHCIGDRTKLVHGFDNWQGFTGFAEQDAAPAPDAGKTVGGFNRAQYREEALDAMAIFDADRCIPFKPRIKLIEDARTRRRLRRQELRVDLLHVSRDVVAARSPAAQQARQLLATREQALLHWVAVVVAA